MIWEQVSVSRLRVQTPAIRITVPHREKSVRYNNESADVCIKQLAQIRFCSVQKRFTPNIVQLWLVVVRVFMKWCPVGVGIRTVTMHLHVILSSKTCKKSDEGAYAKHIFQFKAFVCNKIYRQASDVIDEYIQCTF